MQDAGEYICKPISFSRDLNIQQGVLQVAVLNGEYTIRVI
jgi:hypothetical protein